VEEEERQQQQSVVQHGRLAGWVKDSAVQEHGRLAGWAEDWVVLHGRLAGRFADLVVLRQGFVVEAALLGVDAGEKEQQQAVVHRLDGSFPFGDFQ
jgi:hypothetical protein